MVQWIPGADSTENNALVEHAKNEFRAVLEMDPNDRTAVASLASLEFNEGKGTAPERQYERLRHFAEAENWYRRLVQIDPDDKTAYYSLGVVAWQRFYPELMDARARLGMSPE